MFPYQIGHSYFGDPTGGSVSAITETVTTTFMGGPFLSDAAGGVSVAGNDVTITWQAVEGALYTVEASEDLSTWETISTNVAAVGGRTGAQVELDGRDAQTTRLFHHAQRTGLSGFDRTGFAGTVASTAPTIGGGPNTVTLNTGARGTAVSVVIELDATITPNLPPLAWRCSQSPWQVAE